MNDFDSTFRAREVDPFKIEPTDKQTQFITHTQRYGCMSGGYGCLAGETKIFDPILGRQRRIDEIGIARVYSKAKIGNITLWATKPNKYKKAQLFRAVTERGNNILVTQEHKFFTKDGLWKSLSTLSSGSEQILVYGGFHPLTILGIFPSILLSGVRNFWQKVQGFLWNCFSYYRLCDEQLPLVKAISLVFSPSQADVPLHNLLNWRKDDLELKRERSQFYLSSSLHSKNHSFPHLALLEEDGGYCSDDLISESLFAISPLLWKFLENITLLRKVAVFLLKLRGRFWTWYYNHTLRYEHLSSVSYERTDYYFDLHVPHFNNYFAEGFVNHNSGKSYSGCLRALILSGYPKNVGLIGRLSYRELSDTTRKTFFEICPPDYYDEKQGGRWSPSENNLRLRNGSEILFRHLDTVSEAELKSLNLGWFFIDQAEEVSLAVVRVLMSRLRLNSVPNRYGFFSCNPEPGSWIDDLFKKPFDAGTLDKKDFFYMDSTTYDNPYNPPEYVEDLKKRYPPEMVKRFVDGSWDVLENIIYSEFDSKVHIVNPFTVPKEWEHIVSLDHGLVNPTAVIFAAIDYDYNIYIYDEYYSPGIVSQHAKAIKAKVGSQEISLWLIDPSTSAKTREKEGKPYSIMEEYEDHELYFIPANNQKLAGINRVKEFLKVNPDRINPITRAKGSPRLFVFRNCVNFVWEIKQYKWRKLRDLTQRNAPEQPRDYADHLMDCLYYAILSRFPAPSRHTDGRAMILPADRLNSNIMSVDTSQTAQSDETLGIFGEDGDFDEEL